MLTTFLAAFAGTLAALLLAATVAHWQRKRAIRRMTADLTAASDVLKRSLDTAMANIVRQAGQRTEVGH